MEGELTMPYRFSGKVLDCSGIASIACELLAGKLVSRETILSTVRRHHIENGGEEFGSFNPKKFKKALAKMTKSGNVQKTVGMGITTLYDFKDLKSDNKHVKRIGELVRTGDSGWLYFAVHPWVPLMVKMGITQNLEECIQHLRLDFSEHLTYLRTLKFTKFGDVISRELSLSQLFELAGKKIPQDEILHTFNAPDDAVGTTQWYRLTYQEANTLADFFTRSL